ncbi:MAG: biopolymer transporter ExbD [Myxococcota bacterium]
MDFSNPRSRRSAVEINLTPLIDVVFILLIFFLITSTFVTNEGIEVDTPSASNADSLETSDSITIAITKEGQFIHERTTFGKDELLEKLREHKKTRPGATIIIQGDRDASHGRVTEVMNIAMKAGYDNLAVATEPE